MTAWLLRRLLLGLPAVLILSVAFSAAPASAPVQLLELRGRVLLPEPYQRRVALISLSSVTTPYIVQTRAFHKGRFKFGKLTPGPYTVTVRVRGQGEVRQTIEVGPSVADNRGRVSVELRLEGKPMAGGVSAGSVVSLRQLSIPEKAHGEYQKAMARLAKHDSSGALDHLEKAVALAPQYAEALNTLGTIYYRRQEFPKAEAIFRRALQQSPESFEPLVNLGGVLITERRYLEAMPFNQKAAQARPQEALAQGQLGWDYFYLNRDAEAWSISRKPKGWIRRISPIRNWGWRRSTTGAWSRRGRPTSSRIFFAIIRMIRMHIESAPKS